jgi:PadR family transcriptional regulator PadR
MSERKSNPAFLNGVPEMLILKLLSRQAMYGYELVQAIKTASRDELQFGEGCVYPILHRLESQGVLESAKEVVSGRERVVYRATARGKSQLIQTVGSWQRVVNAVNHALQGGERGTARVA